MTEFEKDKPALNRSRRVFRGRRTTLLMLGLVVVLVSAVAIVSERASTPDDPGLMFVIPAGASAMVDVPTIDSAIVIPVDIRFGPGEVAKITVRNDDSVANRAGPWVVGAGQTYTARFDEPGVYEFECSVDPDESVTVTVTD